MIEVKLLRKGSRGITATIENANHHAQSCLPIIQKLNSMINRMGLQKSFTWEQGNNIHIITNWNGDRICFRPYLNKDSQWGIDVNAKLSRSSEMRLMTLISTESVDRFEGFLSNFLNREFTNVYGSNENANNSRMNTITKKEIDRLNRLMAKSNVGPYALSLKVKIPNQEIKDYCDGKRNPTREMYNKILSNFSELDLSLTL